MPDAHDDLVRVHDAHLHNLRHVSTSFPRGKLVAFTGVSGSGKSSLAFGTIHGEAQRRYLESIAPFARRLIGSAMDPRVESLHGLPPTVALEQRTSGGGARSTVATLTTLSHAIRLLYARAGAHPADVLTRGHPAHGGRLLAEAFSPNTTEGMCPVCRGAGVLHEPTERSMVPDPSLSIDDGAIQAWPGAWMGKNLRDILATLDVAPMDVPWRDIPREAREWILFTDEQPVVTVHPVRGVDQVQRTYEGRWQSVARYLRHAVSAAGSEKTRERALRYLDTSLCPACEGHRLNADALRVTYLGLPIFDLLARSAQQVLAMCEERATQLGMEHGTEDAASDRDDVSPEAEAERLLLPNLLPVLRTMVGLGVGHLTLDRPARTLSTGELQRLRLASQLRAGLFGVAYVLDEPSAGLHPSEKGMLQDLFSRFLDEGNSVLLVEHDMWLIEKADWVIDLGPGAGVEGGSILHSGPVAQLADAPGSRTAAHLGRPLPPLRTGDQARRPTGRLVLAGVEARTIHDMDVEVPLGSFTAITGVSGSGKTTLISDVLARVLGGTVRTSVDDDEEVMGSAEPDAPPPGAERPPRVREVRGAEQIDRLVRITQKPIGRTPRSCLATYTGLFDRVRRLFADTEEARRRGWGVGRFSFNVTAGRCPTCQGEGQIEVELVFLPGTFTPCPDCHGARYTDETLEVTWNSLTIAEVLGLSVREARGVFSSDARIMRALDALEAIGLGYLTLGQSATELSGGEAQRIKLATQLQRTARGHTAYLLDEPTAGLHPADVDLLVAELNRLVDGGSSVIVVEHDMRVVAQADHVIDLGPGAGEDGGRIVASGAPAQVAQVAQCQDSATGRWLSAHTAG
ncbi:excinuclease ABC subunit UvrA [Brachybacterium halotolerans subsp. kimchii]|uniref:excinuclease ABC subunit UvrA n=1 Tax=Brachybacterium halotolerans TaxID=2795215 RepID=UPI001E424E5A|nr:excinuclease ABC subunit UvrA [Brachybacterium halotolerans]UEJ82023.1 excinuclease ABC subunit UvrA [Brachybacterium halotolerans subsp. kimchii]